MTGRSLLHPVNGKHRSLSFSRRAESNGICWANGNYSFQPTGCPPTVHVLPKSRRTFTPAVANQKIGVGGRGSNSTNRLRTVSSAKTTPHYSGSALFKPPRTTSSTPFGVSGMRVFININTITQTFSSATFFFINFSSGPATGGALLLVTKNSTQTKG